MERVSLREMIEQNKYLIFVIYYTFYMVGFVALESVTPEHIYIIHCPLDSYIPFLEIFVIPYLAWFLYIAGAVIWLFFNDRETMERLLWSGMIGMTAFLVISYFLPNGLDLRPVVFERDNIFITLTKMVYGSDTATNVFPSIHVNNTICACAALLSCEKLKDRKGIRAFSLVMAVLIILSTLFLKQHSLIDVSAGLLFAWFSVEVCFGDRLKQFREQGQSRASQRKKIRTKLIG